MSGARRARVGRVAWLAAVVLGVGPTACPSLVRDGQYACTTLDAEGSGCPPGYVCREDARLPGQLRCYETAGPPTGLDGALDGSGPEADAAGDGGVDAARPGDGGPADAGRSHCPTEVCDIAAQSGCADGETCDWVDRRVVCRPSGTEGELALCTAERACAAGLSCVGTRGESRCVTLCCEPGSACAASGQICYVLGGRGTPRAACLPPARCDPFATDPCPAGEQCQPSVIGARCQTVGVRAAGAACTADTDCALGLACNDGSDACTPICRVDDPAHACPAGLVCQLLDAQHGAGLCVAP